MPARAVIVRSLQWVASGGFSLSVRFTTCLIFLAVSGLRPGGRVASFSKPSTPLAAAPAPHREHALAHSRRHLDRTDALAGQKNDLRPPYDLLRALRSFTSSQKAAPDPQEKRGCVQ